MSFLNAPEYMPNLHEWLRKTVRVVNGIMQGRTNNYGSVTLTSNAGSTIVQEAPNRISDYSVIVFMPTTSNAAVAAQTMYVSATSPANNTFTITHANNAQSDKTFRYAIIG